MKDLLEETTDKILEREERLKQIYSKVEMTTKDAMLVLGIRSKQGLHAYFQRNNVAIHKPDEEYIKGRSGGSKQPSLVRTEDIIPLARKRKSEYINAALSIRLPEELS
jgi:archaeosine-15-forming tRNA-guanine transglycosylase